LAHLALFHRAEIYGRKSRRLNARKRIPGLFDGYEGRRAAARGRQLVAYLLGDGNYETTLFRARRGVLGQIINSTPVFIGAATNQGYASLPAELGGKHSGSSTYRAYLKGTKGRQNDKDKLVVVGANDGFVHV